MDYKVFVNQFLKYPKEIGTFTTSSKFLAHQMARAIGDSLHVVEFGSGTGAISLEILKVLRPDGTLTCFELNPAFCRELKKIHDDRLTVVNDLCENAPKYTNCTECIVSSVPLTIMGKPQRHLILALAAKSRKFIQLQYIPVLTKEIKQYFTDVDLKFVPLNLPPAFVYICKHGHLT